MSFLFRPQRGSLDKSMAEVVELQNKDALVQHIIKIFSHYPKHGYEINVKTVKVEKYGDEIDRRIGWDTHIVILKQNFTCVPEAPNIDYMLLTTVVGFVNGPVIDKETEIIAKKLLEVKKRESVFDFTMGRGMVERIK